MYFQGLIREGGGGGKRGYPPHSEQDIFCDSYIPSRNGKRKEVCIPFPLPRKKILHQSLLS